MSAEIIDPPSPSPRSLPSALVIAVGLVLLFAPGVALALGMRAAPIENRPLTELPSLSDGWSAFPQMTGWATDHLPMRKDAIDLNDRLVEGVFGQPPVKGGAAGPPVGGPGAAGSLDDLFPRVIEGSDGWLYFGGDMKNPCLATSDLGDTVADLQALRRVVEDSGRRFVFVVAPDKSTVIPEHLPGSYPGEGCARARKQELWRRLGAADPDGSWLVDLRGPLRARQAADGVPIYRAHDTHWTPSGGAVLGQQLLGLLEPGLTDFGDVVRAGMRERQGDLATLLGRVAVDSYPVWVLQRPGVVAPAEMPGPSAQAVRVTSTTTGAPLFEPRTLLLGDSFTAASTPLVYPLFADLTVVHSHASGDAPARVSALAADAEVVVVELVERDLVSDAIPVLSPELRDALRAALG